MRPWPKAPRVCLLARMLVERRHLSGKVGNVLLRGVEHGQALVQPLQILVRGLGRLAHRLVQAMRSCRRAARKASCSVPPGARRACSAIACMRPVISDCACRSAPMRPSSSTERGAAASSAAARPARPRAPIATTRQRGQQSGATSRPTTTSVSIMFAIADSRGSPEAGAPGLPFAVARPVGGRRSGRAPRSRLFVGRSLVLRPALIWPRPPAAARHPRGRRDADGRRARACRRRCGRSG